ncbi:MAG: cytochrome c peroxidase, partial [Gemmatimonadota bacterium]
MRLSHLALGLASSLAIFSACSDQIASPDVQTGSAAVLSSMSSSSSKVDVGRELFFDMGLSANGNQSCAACHDPKFGF